MPSNRPVIAVRLERPIYEIVLARANAEGRSLSNYVENIVKRELNGAKPKRA
jgi:hypothetical protein